MNNMEFKGTNGPWSLSRAQYSSDGFGDHTGFNITGRLCHLHRDVCNITLNNAVGIPENERHANALLISKSPEMLGLLSEILTSIEREEISQQTDYYKGKILKLINEATKI